MSNEDVCREACEVLSSVPPARIEVLGQNSLGNELRRRLGAGAPRSPRRARLHRHAAPLAVVETTGTAAAVTSALTRVATGGTVVLAGERVSPKLPVNLYPDVHVRGVRMIGVSGAN